MPLASVPVHATWNAGFGWTGPTFLIPTFGGFTSGANLSPIAFHSSVRVPS